MSLPSRAYLLKNGSIIADTFVNVGWVVTVPEVIKCCYETYNACLDEENRAKEGTIEYPTAYILDGWKNFDHILLYDYIIPRITLDEYFLGKLDKIEFEQRFIDGSYIKYLNKWYQALDKIKFNNDFNVKIKEKYGDR